ncbi:uncharacterized protein [Cherax quadricarinatus]|uniref:uncharacterized protein n=1 Tax=Cherax quadricarinatus TaxID=27406 RepID=UPI00387E7A89
MWVVWWFVKGLIVSQVVDSEVIIWYPPVNVSNSFLQKGTKVQLETKSELICAIQASQTAWCNLFQYEDGVCTFYDVMFGYVNARAQSSSQPPAQPTSSCRTKHEWIEPCSKPFSMDTNLGCIYLNTTSVAWTVARSYCMRFGADLYDASDAGNFNALQHYIFPLSSSDVWVGVIARKWLDGSNVTSAQWISWAPNDPPGVCARMRQQSPSLPLLDDIACSTTYSFLCHLNITGQ